MSDMTWRVGDRVRHSLAPDWGLGEVLEVHDEGKIRVFFEDGGERLLKHAPLTRANGSDITRPLIRPRARPGTRSATPRSVSQPKHLSIEAYKAAFVEKFPRGFADSEYIGTEREYKVLAGELLTTSLSLRRLKSMIREGNWDEITKRAFAIMRKTNLVFPQEAMAFHRGLQSAGARERFGRTLFELLYGDGEVLDRFDRYCGLLTEIGAAKWPVATYFQFLADPSSQMLLKPLQTQRIAAACDIEINYRSVPNPLTYGCLLRLSERLMENLRDLGARDMIDVQSFMWCVAR